MRYRTEGAVAVAILAMAGLALNVAVGRAAGPLQSRVDVIALLLGLMTVAIVCAGALWLRPRDALMPRASQPVTGQVAGHLTILVLPALLAAGCVLFVQMFADIAVQSAIVLLGGAAIWGALWAQSHTADLHDRHFALAQSVLNILDYLSAYLAYSAIYGLKVRSAESASLVAFVSFALMFDLLSREVRWRSALGASDHEASRRALYLAVVGGVIAGELTWGLNYWAALNTLVGGAFLLLTFYVIAGLAVSYLDGRLGRQAAVEYSVVGGVGVLAIFASAFLH